MLSCHPSPTSECCFFFNCRADLGGFFGFLASCSITAGSECRLSIRTKRSRSLNSILYQKISRNGRDFVLWFKRLAICCRGSCVDWLPFLARNISLYGLGWHVQRAVNDWRIHSVYFSPIAHIPGPKLAGWFSSFQASFPFSRVGASTPETNQLEILIALTKIYQFYYDVLRGGEFSFKLEELHAKYGAQAFIISVFLFNEACWSVVQRSDHPGQSWWDLHKRSGVYWRSLCGPHKEAREIHGYRQIQPPSVNRSGRCLYCPRN